MSNTIDYKMLLCDLNFEASKRVLKDPEYLEEVRPIHEERARMNDQWNVEVNKIREKYKKKYLQQLYAERDVQKILIRPLLEEYINEIADYVIRKIEDNQKFDEGS